MTKAILYSFRRCPYAMRARLALAISSITVELREVVLRDKPQSLLDVSPKATVPILLSEKEELIDESIDIMTWALNHPEAKNTLMSLNEEQQQNAKRLIEYNDGEFKYFLDRYKYADRYPEHSQLYYRQQAEQFLALLEQYLANKNYLFSDTISITDLAILPFIRQFAFVDQEWFKNADYPYLQTWLNEFLNSDLFISIMKKYPQWHEGDVVQYFPS